VTDDDAKIEELAAKALAENGELIPTTSSEVERAEADLGDVELPESLAKYRPPAPKVVPLRPRRNPVLTHGVAVVLGAAAAWLVFTLTKKPRVDPGIGAPTREPALRMLDAGPDARAIALQAPSVCDGCAPGRADVKDCASGRSCVTCDEKRIRDSRYRLRVGAFVPFDAGRKLISNGNAGLELCVRVGSSDRACVPAHADAGQTEIWSKLPHAVSATDLVAALGIEVKVKGATRAAGEWVNAVQITPSVLCKGLSIKIKNADDESLGAVSVFLDDTYFVELGRAGSLPPLQRMAELYEFGALTPSVFETSKSGDERLSLEIGPFDKQAAEAVRWQILKQGGHGRLGYGIDHLGEPRSLR
jgi:hypothetical protein